MKGWRPSYTNTQSIEMLGGSKESGDLLILASIAHFYKRHIHTFHFGYYFIILLFYYFILNVIINVCYIPSHTVCAYSAISPILDGISFFLSMRVMHSLFLFSSHILVSS